MKLIALFFLFTIVNSTAILAQDLGQTISGKVTNHISQKPLVGASVSVLRVEKIVAGAVTDSLGTFQIQHVAVGRYKLIVSFTGFSSVEDELLIISGRTNIVDVSLNESATVLKEVEVRSNSYPAEAGVTTISIEKTMRVPANFFDPARMITSYPGVVTASDQSNSIIVKGYSPTGILWRLQGLDIVNPNHLANAGTFSDKPVANGGGVNILSAQLLDKTDFHSGSMPSSFGNALSGVMSMKLRTGNADKIHYTAQASLLGLDLAVEGPLNKNKRTTFLANYRYSTLGLLSKAGIDFGDEKISFQDFSLHLNHQYVKGGNLSIFGFVGQSSNNFAAKPIDMWEEEKDRYTILYNGKTYAIGVVNSFKPIGKTAFSIGASVSGQQQDRTSQSMTVPQPHIDSEVYSNDKLLFSSFFKAIRKINTTGTIEAGVMTNYLDDKLLAKTITPLYFDIFNPNLRGTVSGVMLQPYVAWSQRVATFNINAGVRYAYFGYNKAASLQPRISIGHNIANGTFTFSYSKVGQWQQSRTYLEMGNANLGLTEADQFVLEYKHLFIHDIKLLTNIYYHQIHQAPLLQSIPAYSTLNQFDDFVPANLQSIGKGRNKGIELLLEKRFYSQLYFMIGGSVYDSKYAVEGVYYNTRFNGRFTSSFLSGKEWQKKQKAFGIHVRVLYLGGLREAPINAFVSDLVGSTQYNLIDGYSVRLPNYFRSDLRLSWRKNKPGFTRTVSLDIQNLTNQQNIAYHYYDTYWRQVKVKYQLGIIPVISYRIEF